MTSSSTPGLGRKQGIFTISLDLEKLWGVHDSRPLDSYRGNLAGVDEVVDALLERFSEKGIAATWATVGMLMCENVEEARALAPPHDARPIYKDPRLDPYRLLRDDALATSERTLLFAPHLVKRIAATGGQEVATHTFAHYLCLEDGASPATFEADLEAAHRVADARGVEFHSIVFPRNQYAVEHLEVCRRQGLVAFRGNPDVDAHRPSSGVDQTPWMRAVRLLDAYLPISKPTDFEVAVEGAVANVRASRFLRPSRREEGTLGVLRLRRVLAEMRRAAQRGRCYHLWWHPHNFGRDLEANLLALDEILTHYAYLRERFDMRSATMRALGSEALSGEAA
ncbi:MAG TPA: polysaccharide deacetylase family protein [Sandaracinaceae bacterium LLY-WYZ-13_1]|nr:polysaccharide deacetylase family protein [Sandaracinaceae bacterium LLY-WYZ-13_1]